MNALNRFSRASARRLSSAPFLSNVMVIAGGSAIAQLVPVILTPVLARLYSPADMGQLGLYIAFHNFATSASTLGYAISTVSAESDDEAADLTMLSLLMVGPTSMLLSGLFWVFISRDWLGLGELPGVASIAMVLSLVLTGLYFSMRYWLIRSAKYRIISEATVAQGVGRGVTQVLLGLASAGWIGLVSGEMLGRAFGLRRMWEGTWNQVASRILPLNLGRLWSVAVRYKKFPLYSMPSSLVNGLSLVLPVPLISAYFGLQEAGQFSVASRVLLLPLALIGASVSDVFHSRIAGYAREKSPRAVRFFFTVAGGLLLLGLLPMAIVMLAGESLWAMVLGDTWRTAGTIAAGIAPWALMQFAVSPVSRVVAVYQAQEHKLVYDVLALGSIVGVLSLGHNRGWSIGETCAALGWSQAAVYAVYFVLLARIVRRGQA